MPRSIDDPVPSHEVNIDGTFNVLRAAREGGVGRVVYAASSSAYGDTEVLPKVETMTPQPEIALRAAETGGRVLRRRFCGRLRAGNRVAALLQRLRPAAGPVQPLFGRALAVHEGRPGAEIAHDLRRWRTIPRFHLRRRRGGIESEGRARTPRLGQHVQRRQRRPHHAEPGVGTAAEASKASASPRTTVRRARATCAIRRPTPPPPSAIWATSRNSASKKACVSRSSGTATLTEAPETLPQAGSWFRSSPIPGSF